MQKRERERKEREPKKPVYSIPTPQKSVEGFTSSFTKGSVSASNLFGSYTTQIKTGTRTSFEATPLDKFYDQYATNEIYAMALIATRFKDLTPATPDIPTYGSTLGSFDSETTQIPWDTDNKDYHQSDIVWGTVSKQASRSIYLKSWLQELIARSAEMEKCGESTAYYCYHSPMFPVEVRDQDLGRLLQGTEALTQAIGQEFQMRGISSLLGDSETNRVPVFNPDGSPLLDLDGNKITAEIENTFRNRALQNQNTYNRLFGTKPSIPIEAVPTTRVQLGPNIRGAVGDRKLNKLAAELEQALKKKFILELDATRTKVIATASSVEGAAAAAEAAAIASSVATAGATSWTVVVATAVLTFVTFFFGTFQMILMGIEAILTPIINSLFHPGGICPSGSQRLSLLIPDYAITLISTFIPMGSFLQLFDPFICWSPDGSVHLMTPPKIPPFMSDRTLSLIYHANWVASAGNIPNIPRSQTLTIEKDPLPANYVWLKDAGLSGDANALTQFARDHATSTVSSITTGGSINGIPDYIAVELCATGTTSTADGKRCEPTRLPTNSSAPKLVPCASSEYDDGFNCWSIKSSTCTGGEIAMTSSTTWDDKKGYMDYTITPLVCDGVTVSTQDARNSGIKKFFTERIYCDAGYEHNPGENLCYKSCPAGYRRQGAICESTVTAYTRKYMFATHSLYYDQPYTPETMNTLADVNIPYCNFADPIMLDRMAQFYYNNSINNPVANADGTVTVQIITKMLGVTASSELSCDVACIITFMTYDPITGDKFSAVAGCSYESDPTKDGYDPVFAGCPFCFRRFYFILGDNDTQGLFTVTGCTFADYTAPESMVYTGDLSANILPGLPKTWKEVDKTASIEDVANLQREWENGHIGKSIGQGLLDVGLMLGAGMGAGAAALKLGAGAAKQAAAGLVGGVGAGLFTSMWMDKACEAAGGYAVQSASVMNTIDTFVTGIDNKNLAVVSNNNWWTVYHGPIYELAPGYVPTINFCEQRVIGADYCTHKYVIRDMVNKYHNEYQYKHIQQITEIEPRGNDGCYYKWLEVDYDPATNIEGVVHIEKEMILQHQIKDYASCTYEPTTFNANMLDENYSVRSYIDPATIDATEQKIRYPMRNEAYKSDLIARFVRIRPPLTPQQSNLVGGSSGLGDSMLNLGQISVFDVSGFNISMKMPTYSTSTSTTSASDRSVVNGILSVGDTLSSVWQPLTSGLTEYWEVDLSNNMNISQVVYSGGSIKPGRNIGVRIEFLYSNGINDTPIYTYTLKDDSKIQTIPFYSSKTTTPMYPVAGPITIPRPYTYGVNLGIRSGCVNRCENKDIMDSLMLQYNNKNPTAQIIKILRGVTASETLCEYQAEIFVQDTPTKKDEYGITTTQGKSSVVKQYVSIPLSARVTNQGGSGPVFARFIRITPSFTPGTLLEISKVLVYNAIPDPSRNDGVKMAGYNVAEAQPPTYTNLMYELDEMQDDPTVGITDGTSTPAAYPHIFMARSNQADTFLQIDLEPPDSPSCLGMNYEIYQIVIVGRADRQLGGMKGVTVELFANPPNGDTANCCMHKYSPVFSYKLPTDETSQTIRVVPVPQCTFALQGTGSVLSKPIYLQDNSPPFSTTDTSGGVFSFSGIVTSIKDVWDGILPISSTDMVAPITENVKQSDAIVHDILETVSAAQTIAGTTKRCTDTDVLAAIMTAYNVSKGPKHTDEFSIQKYTMNRILKAGQSRPNTCDVLFEEIYEIYDDYITDITDPDNYGKNIRSARFTMDTNAVPARDEPGTPPINIMDISSNAVGLLTNAGNLPVPFSGPSYAVKCRDPTVLSTIKVQLEKKDQGTYQSYNIKSSFKSVTQSFQSTPLSCEYMMKKDNMYTSSYTNNSYSATDLDTWVKAVYTLGIDGKTTTLSSVTEYLPEKITYSSDSMHVYMEGDEIYLPSLYTYNPTKLVSKRVDTTVQNI